MRLRLEHERTIMESCQYAPSHEYNFAEHDIFGTLGRVAKRNGGKKPKAKKPSRKNPLREDKMRFN